MRIMTGLLFFLSQSMLLGWLLFGSKRFLQEIVLVGAEETGPEQRSRRSAPAFRGAIVAVCSSLAGLAGYLLPDHAVTGYETWKLGAALLGVSAAGLADFYIHIIPNRFLLYTCAARVLIFAGELLGGRPDWKQSLLNSVIGFSLAFVILLLFSCLTRQGMGMGDVKLIAVLGFLGGIGSVVNTLVCALLLCVAVSAVLLARKRKGLKDKIPFGPFIYFGYVATLCMGAF